MTWQFFVIAICLLTFPLAAAFIVYELRHALTDGEMRTEEGNDPDGPDLFDGQPI